MTRNRKIKAMPYELKQKLRQLDKYNSKAKDLHHEIMTMLDKYEVPYDNLVANSDIYSNEPRTEALAYINNAEGDVEENIKEMEEVFLYFANNGNQAK